MKHTRLAILILIAFLNTSRALGQTGWSRMPDQIWSKELTVRFHNSTLGFVQQDWVDNQYDNEFGAKFYLTSDGGQTWLTISKFQGGHSMCNKGYNEYQLNTYRIAGAYLNSQRFNVVATHVLSNCWHEEPSYTSIVWSLNLKSKKTQEMHFLGRGPSLLHELADGTLIGSSEDYMFWYNRGPGTALRSTDSGNTWSQFLEREGEDSRVFVAQFANKDTGYVGTTFSDTIDRHLMLTALRWTLDGGKSWRRDTIDGNLDIFAGPQYGNNGLWYAKHIHTTDGYFASSDVGLTWTKTNTPPIEKPWRHGKAFYYPSSGYRITHRDNEHSTIEFTSDSGRTWQHQIEVDGYLTSISAPSERVAYAVGLNGILYKTTDGGGRFADVKQTNTDVQRLSAWSSGNEIVVEGADGEKIQIFDLLGRLVRSGSESRFGGMPPGAYIITSGGGSVTVLVSP